jgi:hypothetical protein
MKSLPYLKTRTVSRIRNNPSRSRTLRRAARDEISRRESGGTQSTWPAQYISRQPVHSYPGLSYTYTPAPARASYAHPSHRTVTTHRTPASYRTHTASRTSTPAAVSARSISRTSTAKVPTTSALSRSRTLPSGARVARVGADEMGGTTTKVLGMIGLAAAAFALGTWKGQEAVDFVRARIG